MNVKPALALTILLAIGCVLVARSAPFAAAHPELIRAEPPIDAMLTVPPRQVELWLTEAAASGAGSPALTVLDQSGGELPAGEARIDSLDPTHVELSVTGIESGTYTVVWSIRSSVDGHTLTGSYAFRVGGGRAPGAATVEGESPPPWAPALRWLTFLGAALVAGSALGWSASTRQRSRVLLALFGGAIAVGATLAEPLFGSRWPPAGTIAPSLADAVRAQPDAWQPRLLALVLACAGSILAWRLARPRRFVPRPLMLFAATSALIALLGLSWTSHASARRDWREIALAVNIAHQWSVALWFGGLAALAIADRSRGALLLFSRRALPLALVALLTGVINAGFVLPVLESLRDTTYGRLLLIKIAILTPALLLATFHRAALQGWLRRFPRDRWLPSTVRLEAAFLLLVVLGGATLALLAPPILKADRPTTLNLAVPLLGPPPGQESLVHLALSPARPGPNTVAIRLARTDNQPPSEGPPVLARVRFTSLEHDVETAPVEANAGADGAMALGDVQLGLEGWWRADVTLRWRDRVDVTVPFVLLLPDPNLNGLDAVPARPADPAAEAIYNAAMARYTGLHRVRYRQHFSDGNGLGVISDREVNDGADGQLPALRYRNVTTNGWEAIIVGNQRWSRLPGEAWEQTDAVPMIPPSEWDEEYTGATGFQFGRIEEFGGEPCQIVTFVVPEAPRRVVAWYVWWIGLETGQVRRDVMISRVHYMQTDFSDFDAPMPIMPPET